MILEPNVPDYVRRWAVCQVELRLTRYALKRYQAGDPATLSQSWMIRHRGRQKFIEEVAKPAIRRLERRRRRYQTLIRAYAAQGSPLRYLSGRKEMLELIGNILHCRDKRSRSDMFVTLQCCSRDGKRLFSSPSDASVYTPEDPRCGFDELVLLGLGFGRTL